MEVPAVPYPELTGRKPGTGSQVMRKVVHAARKIQYSRQGDGTTNSSLATKGLKAFCDLTDACLLLMRQAMTELGLSARAYDKVRRVARTIADLEGEAEIKEHHLAEGIQYRLLDRKF